MYLGNPANWHLPLLRPKLPPTGIGTCSQFVAVTLPCPFSLSHLWPHRWEHSGHLTQAEAIKVLLSRIWTWVKEEPARLCWPLKLRTWNLHDFAWTLHRIVVSQLPNVHGSGGTGGEKRARGRNRVKRTLGMRSPSRGTGRGAGHPHRRAPPPILVQVLGPLGTRPQLLPLGSTKTPKDPKVENNSWLELFLRT